MPSLKKSLLCMASMSVLTAGLASGTALAQSETNSQVDDVIVVQGIRQSLQQSIAQKRNSDAIIDAITATDVGRFPDKNVAESLQRLPGISISREYGEGERVSIRGVASNRNLTQMNGHNVATADWFILDQLSATRSFNFLMLPSEIVGNVQVYKSSQANIDEGGVGGTVNIETRKPLDLDSLEFRLSAQGAYNDLAGETTPYVSGLVSWKNENETIGILAAAMYQERELRRDGIEVLGYTARNIADQGGESLFVPDLIGSALFNQTRKRKGGNIAIQFRPNSQFEGTLNAFHSEMDANNVNYNYMFWGARMAPAGQPYNTEQGADGTLLRATWDAIPGTNGVVYDTIVREATTKVNSVDFDFEYAFGEGTTLHGKIGHTHAEGGTNRQPFWEVNASTGVSYDLTSGTPKVTFTDIDPNSAADAQALALGWASLENVSNTDDEFFAYGDVTHEFSEGPFSNIQVGAKYAKHDRDVDFIAGRANYLIGGANVAECGNSTCSLATVYTGQSTPSDFLDGIGGSGTLNAYLLADPGAIRSIYDQANVFHFLNPGSSFGITEEIKAAYVMTEFNVDRIRGNIGVRYVNTEHTVMSYNVGVPAGTPGAFDNPFGPSARTYDSRSYDDILPSANFVFDLNEDMVLRASASRVMARPDYNQLTGAVSLTDSLLVGSGGNPELDPFRATAFDFGFEWYPSDDSMLSVAVFYKDIASYISNKSVTERHALTIPNGATDGRVTNAANNCVATPVASNADLYTCDYQITRASNGAGGRNQGVEISYQQPLPHNFGFVSNYTYSDAEADNGDPIPENSQHAINLIGYFENDWLNARLSYNYRSEFYLGVDRNMDLYHKPISSLDGSVTWYAHENIALTLEAVNITGETLEQYYELESRPARLYDNGRTFYFGVKASY
ncbi:TonB-dependent receptor [Woodsholea maritima]|uniref:TonB-dependent receptor n=1 Tax=Woodsholea maritima TaxID=240237 RepID=UPI00039C4DA6|nr:TonB-dependent receptor [Woodsholea maritima]